MSLTPEVVVADAPGPWLVRVPEVFAPEAATLLRQWSPGGVTPLGTEFHWLRDAAPGWWMDPAARLVVSWRLPVHHSWPCRPRTMTGFVEKAAQALARRFGEAELETVLVGLLQTGTPNTYYRKLASNLRGRALQLLPHRTSIPDEVRPDNAVLFCLLGPEGLFAGRATPREVGGFRAGGHRSLPRQETDVISRAGAKADEALEFLRLHRPLPPNGAHWLELGASPGGMTAVLLRRGYKVTAVDRAPLDRRLHRALGLTVVQSEAAEYRAAAGSKYDALLCDMNGPAETAMRAVVMHQGALNDGAPVLFTLKLPGAGTIGEILRSRDRVLAQAQRAGLAAIAQSHLPSNRREFTLVFEKIGDASR